MLNLDHYIDLPLVWGGLLSFAIFLYVLLDGFDLGIGILFPFAPEHKCRDRMMNSVAPFWDGNETWLVLGGGGLFAAFPLAYSIMMSALYLPVLLMLIALIFRGVAFEFRYKATPQTRWIWDNTFHFGSLFAAFMQGIILGAIVQGIKVDGRSFSGGSFDWLTSFSMMTGIAVVFGYTLLGATWLIMKTEDVTQAWARKAALYAMIMVMFFLAIVSIWVPFLDTIIYQRWFSWPNLLYLSPVPILTGLCFIALLRSLLKKFEYQPFLLSIGIFILGFIGLVVGLWPWVIPYSVGFREAAAAPESQSLLLVGGVIILPIILCYTGFCYYVFRGKTSHEHTY